MAFPRGFGPVFEYEMLTSARRWQLYAGRALLVGGLLAGLSVVWVNQFRFHQMQTLRELSEVGKAFYHAIMWVELILILMAVPAATAGAVCVDKMRGGLLLMLATDLTDFEIVFGKLASRLAAVLGILCCGMPVLALTSWMGGVDPWDAICGTLVLVGLAILAVSLTLTFSVWATRPNDALLATYATWVVWLLGLPTWWWINRGPKTGFLEWTFVSMCPFQLILDPAWTSQRVGPVFLLAAANFTISIGISLALAWLCVARIRRVTVKQAGRSQSAGRRRRPWPRPRLGWPDVAIDRNPLLWRERYHSTTTGMARKVWILYVGLSTLFVLWVSFLDGNKEIKAFGGGVMVAVGLLFVSTTAATRFAEERAHGSLDVLLTTPLSSREIVEGKSWSAYRDVPGLALLAALLSAGLRFREHSSPLELIVASLLLAGLVLAYGAVVTNVGVASAVYQARLGRAIALSVTLYLAAALIYPFAMILLFRAGPEHVVWLWPSPLFGVFMQLERAAGLRPNEPVSNDLRVALLTAFTLLVATLVRRTTVHLFDRLLDRVPRSYAPSFQTPRRRRTVTSCPRW